VGQGAAVGEAPEVREHGADGDGPGAVVPVGEVGMEEEIHEKFSEKSGKGEGSVRTKFGPVISVCA
jgi:hypothetical protein